MFRWGIIKSSSARIERRCCASRIYSLIVRKRARPPKRTLLESVKNSRDDTAVTNLIYNDVKARLVSSLKGSINAISWRYEFPNDSNAPWKGPVDLGIIVTYGGSVFIHDSHLTRYSVLKYFLRLRSYKLEADAFWEFKIL